MSNQVISNNTTIYESKKTQLLLPFSDFTPAANITVRFVNLEDNDENPTILLYISNFTGTSSATTTGKTISGVPAEFIPTQNIYIPWGMIENGSQQLRWIVIATNGTISVTGTFTIGLTDGITGGTTQYKIKQS